MGRRTAGEPALCTHHRVECEDELPAQPQVPEKYRTKDLRRVTRAVKRRARAISRAARPVRIDTTFMTLPLDARKQIVKRLAEDRQHSINRYRAAVEALRLTARRSEDEAKLYEHAVSRLGVDELSLFDIVMLARNLRAPISHGDSFFRKMIERRRLKQLGSIPERSLGLTKSADLAFARAANVRVPRTSWTGQLHEIPLDLRHGTFLKPTRSSGAKGAFYLFGEDDMFSVFSSQRISNWDELLVACRSQMTPVAVDDVEWEVQELVTEAPSLPARDIKFFAFYGQIGLIQEVSRYPRKEYEFFDEDGSVAACGRDRNYEPRFLNSTDTITDKAGLSDKKLETVRKFSLKIPAPFMRIDFLNGENELVFCEFSASPGMAHTFNRKYDRILGRMYNEATIRLTNDLLAGKTFDAFHSWSEGPVRG